MFDLVKYFYTQLKNKIARIKQIQREIEQDKNDVEMAERIKKLLAKND